MEYNCMDCGQPTNSLWIIDKREAIDRGLSTDLKDRRKVGRCGRCNNARLLTQFPPPRLYELGLFGINSEEVTGLKKWPWRFIPMVCPYCYGKIKATFIGQGHGDHVLHSHICENCKVYFGQTD